MTLRINAADNRRVRNAQSREYDGIKFKSLAEIMVYKTLLDEGFAPQYEKETFVIADKINPTVPFYTANSFHKKNKNIEILKKSACKDSRSLSQVTYVPDFTFDCNGKHIIVEVKGFSTDTFKYRFKMFRLSLEQREDKDNLELWEIHSKRQLLECISNLKENK